MSFPLEELSISFLFYDMQLKLLSGFSPAMIRLEQFLTFYFLNRYENLKTFAHGERQCPQSFLDDSCDCLQDLCGVVDQLRIGKIPRRYDIVWTKPYGDFFVLLWPREF